MEIDRERMQDAAYAMEKAYKETNCLGDATHKVFKEFDDLPPYSLTAMWYAIDAWVDINK